MKGKKLKLTLECPVAIKPIQNGEQIIADRDQMRVIVEIAEGEIAGPSPFLQAMKLLQETAKEFRRAKRRGMSR